MSESSDADLERIEELSTALAAANAAVAQADEDLERFAYVASHDLQTPARNIQNLSELLREELAGDITDETAELLDLIGLSVDRMRTLIDGLLHFSRVQRAADSPNANPTNVDRVLTDLATRIVDADDDQIELTWSNMPSVQADPHLLRLLFEHLVTNAINFRHPDRPPRISVTAVDQGDAWRFAVRDNGIGIEPRFQDRVFDMFTRLHAHDDATGAGIGLALCKRIVERSGGKIWLESTVDVGTTVSFTVAKG